MELISNFPLIFTIYLILSTGILLTLLLTTIVNSIFGPFLKNAKPSKYFPKVSVLIPARNEERNIERCISSLLIQDYPNFEIFLLDDNSDDNTYNLAEKYLSYNRFNLLKGKALEKGWLGKNWACHQLSQAGTGEYLIFTDADNFYEKDALSKSVGLAQKYNLDMLSSFPQQITTSFSEKLIIPIIDLIVYSGLLLWSTLLIPLNIFSAANGQWILFKRSAYNAIDGHIAVRNNIVEDVALSRLIKSRKMKLLTTAGTGIIYGKMYTNFGEVWNGLTKNVYGLTNFKSFPFFVLIFLIFICSLLPYFLIYSESLRFAAIVLISFNTIWRIILSIRFKHNILISVFLQPLSIFMFLLIAINSFIQSTYGKLKWKNREIDLK
jgi:chlorobactene glucosyltransferase